MHFLYIALLHVMDSKASGFLFIPSKILGCEPSLGRGVAAARPIFGLLERNYVNEPA